MLSFFPRDVLDEIAVKNANFIKEIFSSLERKQNISFRIEPLGVTSTFAGHC